MSIIGDLIKKLRKNSKRLYRSGWQNEEVSVPSQFSQPMVYQATSDSTTSSITQGEWKTMKSEVAPKDERIEKKPVEVVKELLCEEPVMNLENLDKQVRIVARRLKVLTEEAGVNATDEKIALAFLKARQKWMKNRNHFRWAITTPALVQALCRKYKLADVNFTSYYKNIPMEAIDELESYSKAYHRVRDDEPVLRLIIDDAKPAPDKPSPERKKDPILLAGSPFGNWLYVLGAWDKEVEFVDDIIYKGK